MGVSSVLQMKAVKTVHDTVTLTLNEADLTGKKVGEYIRTPLRKVACSDGLEWSISCHPAGRMPESANHISLLFNVTKTVSTRFEFKINGLSFLPPKCHYFSHGGGHGFAKFASHEELRPLFTDGQLAIICEVAFDISVPFSFLATPTVRLSDHVPTDFELVVGLDRVKVHKGYISLISPVFHAMLSHDTAEAKSGKVDIKDFDFETVKAAINFCYGREPENLCVDTIVGILRFADKYDVVTVELSKIPLANISPETFATVAHYAYDCSKHDLFNACCKYFKEHEAEIVTTEKFTALTPNFVAHLLKEAFHVKTPYDVLRHAYANGIGFILEPLEQFVIEKISLDTFCTVVTYAWECSRDDLKNVCGKFFNDNQAEIRKMKEFYDLPPNVVYEMLKKGYDVL
uniref:BTB domain-containing protein n=1 Tax=Panagrellus redivivus TaxID=6233 RepID=A0A7E4ZZZ6_PANRE